MTVSSTLVSATDLLESLQAKQYAKTLQQLHALPIKNAWLTLRLLHDSLVPQGESQHLRAFIQDFLYRAHRLELEAQWDDAKRFYQLLLQHSTNKKITIKARQGLKRIAESRGTQLPQTLTKPATQELTQNLTQDLGVLILKPVNAQQKEHLISSFADIMAIDAYSARLQIPVRGLRLYRYGSSRELRDLSQTLLENGIPNICLSLTQIQALPVCEVAYLSSVDNSKVTAIVRQAPDQWVPLEFEWSAVQQQVEGQLPLFEEILVRDRKQKLMRKTSTNDYAHFCDLHLASPRCILRFYDEAYQFNQGVPLLQPASTTALIPKTSWAQWKGLKQILAHHLPEIPIAKDFNHFAETVVDQIEILAKLESHIRLCRREDSYWDHAFQLYSSLIFLQSSSQS